MTQKSLLELASLLFGFFGVIILLSLISCNSKPDFPEHEYVIAFGSCNHEDDHQDYWNTIDEDQPDLWIWMGDIIYADTEDMAVMKGKYDLLKSNKYYKKFADHTSIIGTWDDHDYGQNDGNKTYLKKEESKAQLLQFLDIEADNPVHDHEGVYQSYMRGSDEFKIKCILLDTRYFQDPLESNPDRDPRYLLNDGDILGEAQWAWLADELKPEGQDLNVIVSSIQYLANEQIFEKWGNFPNARKRLEELLITSREVPSLILSGDRHIGEISRSDIPGLSFPLYDITSSGLTHSYEAAVEENTYRIGPLVSSKNYGLLRVDKGDKNMRISAQIKNIEGELIVEEMLDILN